ncbi:hypothetical protein [Halomonas sp. HG01]|uniref:hypothetical protein n=1 Tax=Halomonas sp. HG01 TaxID=1609967 RepID=UPI000614587E|nr:hypothetical protein [Halomonas sp. HG01]
MKYPVREPLRHNGKTHRPPGEVELDPKEDAAEIEHLTRKGVIGAPGDADEADAQDQAKDDEAATANADDATPEQDGESAAKDDGAEAGDKTASKPASRRTAGKTTKAKE